MQSNILQGQVNIILQNLCEDLQDERDGYINALAESDSQLLCALEDATKAPMIVSGVTEPPSAINKVIKTFVDLQTLILLKNIEQTLTVPNPEPTVPNPRPRHKQRRTFQSKKIANIAGLMAPFPILGQNVMTRHQITRMRQHLKIVLYSLHILL